MNTTARLYLNRIMATFGYSYATPGNSPVKKIIDSDLDTDNRKKCANKSDLNTGSETAQTTMSMEKQQRRKLQ